MRSIGYGAKRGGVGVDAMSRGAFAGKNSDPHPARRRFAALAPAGDPPHKGEGENRVCRPFGNPSLVIDYQSKCPAKCRQLR
jgi:hypothetical protein